MNAGAAPLLRVAGGENPRLSGALAGLIAECSG